MGPSSRHPPQRPVTAALALALAVGISGCSTDSGAGVPATTTSITSATESPVQVCARQVSYWVGESLRLAPDQGFDYQHMGLSGRTYDVVRAVTAQARAAGRSDAGWVADRALEACEEAIRMSPDATSTSGGWP